MKKINIIIICLVLLMITLSSGCVSKSIDAKLTKRGVLIDVVYHRGWFDMPNSVELFFFDMTTVVINDEWNYVVNESRYIDYGIKLDELYSFCNYNIGNNVTIVYEKGLCHSIIVS